MISDVSAAIGFILCVALISWNIYIEIRLAFINSQLMQERQKNKDAKIADKIHNLSDSELTALLGDKLGRSDDP